MNTMRLPSLRWLLALGALFAWVSPRPAAAQSGEGIPDVWVWNAANQRVRLKSALRDDGRRPVILLPVYTRCPSSCRRLTRKLERETARMDSGTPYRVAVVSFDPAETPEDLRAFRERERLPSQWMLLRAEGPEIRRIFDFLEYPIMSERGLLVHPNKIFLLDGEFHWRWTLVGEDWSSVELQRRLGQIAAPGLLGWAAMNPATLVFIGCGGLLASLAIVFACLIAGGR